ncbi:MULTISPECIES: hypothetical protein [Methylocaldum]|uniref:hypothetical protein n=1 Tax=unclassified Methylocaldum TaxID=2622260 RepID=UPI000A3280C2|nr:hypothetical protein [Methylocaldum sp. RMAD-M]MBP1150694.1 hypothetical protein [Methylocaldum sp. RMAD-M]MVF22394.1 hypothetical protein [Methylocaldum sp. BRCS4]
MSRLLALIDKVVGPSVEMADSAHGADARLAYWIPSPGSADADLLPEFDLLTLVCATWPGIPVSPAAISRL